MPAQTVGLGQRCRDTRCRVASFRRERGTAHFPEPWQRKALAAGWKPPSR